MSQLGKFTILLQKFPWSCAISLSCHVLVHLLWCCSMFMDWYKPRCFLMSGCAWSPCQLSLILQEWSTKLRRLVLKNVSHCWMDSPVVSKQYVGGVGMRGTLRMPSRGVSKQGNNPHWLSIQFPTHAVMLILWNNCEPLLSICLAGLTWPCPTQGVAQARACPVGWYHEWGLLAIFRTYLYHANLCIQARGSLLLEVII